MRVLIVAESFLPNVNGVTTSVCRVLEHLRATGHEACVIAPGARPFQEEIPQYAGFDIHRVPTVMMPRINSLPIGVPTREAGRIMRDYAPDVVHVASPFALAGRAIFRARALGLPVVAVYQTDVAGFAQRYRLQALTRASWAWTRAMHNAATRTLAPSTAAAAALHRHGIRNIHLWGRGVDTELYHPDARSDTTRARWGIPHGTPIVGYVGRLAAEKGVHRLAALADRRDLALVIVGDGPERARLQQLLPDAVFTGALHGEELARAYAAMDVFVHPGEFETFCQTIQEAHASGTPTIAPRAGGPIDLVRHGVDGALLDIDTFTRDLPGSVDMLLARGAQARRASRAAVAGRTWAHITEELLGHYADAIATRV
ncbi:alpha-mannosyltransferase [Corynebacterium sp. 13CS0277]|uniref:glycosyltransferase family 4 protein n=1 Tax=Corynebacterium sp. 13CS0277 TaxID=2071994 RepID=UPI000D02B551|nr:glycosyltransferase family 1 protein [Corynebacterium sp. 13CS0277]PRQ10654.1 alpha-mannosyltransferase [Corynebacterium sp. 13CS0277]